MPGVVVRDMVFDGDMTRAAMELRVKSDQDMACFNVVVTDNTDVAVFEDYVRNKYVHWARADFKFGVDARPELVRHPYIRYIAQRIELRTTNPRVIETLLCGDGSYADDNVDERQRMGIRTLKLFFNKKCCVDDMLTPAACNALLQQRALESLWISEASALLVDLINKIETLSYVNVQRAVTSLDVGNALARMSMRITVAWRMSLRVECSKIVATLCRGHRFRISAEGMRLGSEAHVDPSITFEPCYGVALIMTVTDGGLHPDFVRKLAAFESVELRSFAMASTRNRPQFRMFDFAEGPSKLWIDLRSIRADSIRRVVQAELRKARLRPDSTLDLCGAESLECDTLAHLAAQPIKCLALHDAEAFTPEQLRAVTFNFYGQELMLPCTFYDSITPQRLLALAHINQRTIVRPGHYLLAAYSNAYAVIVAMDSATVNPLSRLVRGDGDCRVRTSMLRRLLS